MRPEQQQQQQRQQRSSAAAKKDLQVLQQGLYASCNPKSMDNQWQAQQPRQRHKQQQQQQQQRQQQQQMHNCYCDTEDCTSARRRDHNRCSYSSFC